MKSLYKVFIRVFVTEFFRINAGFFFIATALCFGFLSGREHLALAQAFVSSYIVLLIPLTVWVLYALKIIAFNRIILSKTENIFVYISSGLPSFTIWRSLVLIALLQFMPVLVYGLFLILIAIQTKQFVVIALILTSLITLIFSIAQRVYTILHKPDQGKEISLLKNKLDRWLTKPFHWFYPEWIIRNQPLLVVGSKLFACLILIATSRLYLFDTYDYRLFAMGCVLAFTANLVIIFYYHRFTNFHFVLLRSLPINLTKRLVSFMISIALLNLCEWGVLLNYFPDALSLLDLVQVIAFGLSIYWIAYASLFIKDLNLELFIQKAGIAAFVWIILILFKVPLLFIAATHFIAGYFIHQKNFYTFEFNSEINSEK